MPKTFTSITRLRRKFPCLQRKGHIYYIYDLFNWYTSFAVSHLYQFSSKVITTNIILPNSTYIQCENKNKCAIVACARDIIKFIHSMLQKCFFHDFSILGQPFVNIYFFNEGNIKIKFFFSIPNVKWCVDGCLCFTISYAHTLISFQKLYCSLCTRI